MKRRDIFKILPALPLLGGLTAHAIPLEANLVSSFSKQDLIKDLGLRPFINAAGNYTFMTGSIMPEDVMEAIKVSSSKYLMLDEVQDKVGDRIASLCRAEAATVTAGCWSAMVLGMAGVLTGMDSSKVGLLPHLEGTDMKSEVILQKSHSEVELALKQAGAKLILVETRKELEDAINERTAMLYFLNKKSPKGLIKDEEWVAIGQKYNLPTMINIAADVPPVENLWKFNDMGFDLVVISGGKAMCGPQSTGILMGRKDLIAAARLSANPRGGVGRGQKVNKEEILGMYVALDRFIHLDHAKQWAQWEDAIAYIDYQIKSINGVTTEVVIPPTDNNMPFLKVSWDPHKIDLTSAQMDENLTLGTPSIKVISWELENHIRIGVHTLFKGEEKEVAKRVKEELLKAS
ncbi:aminotransferase class V-fold PLP-dependent enzyme [Arenibacter algicola]|uniref:aminotransferase class V-fold PLP-dependent enzyme n=1 Tax=Arenibacter algicola TaxID=616991 RepID=UPI001C06C314|nr:aminotransferase class V-fold PLP-dependent enzyme [Arenibacter algicola]MBU2904091.1 aminotransferase class V-fold PLP-dependent enzyme [Arenibacter algicola]